MDISYKMDSYKKCQAKKQRFIKLLIWALSNHGQAIIFQRNRLLRQFFLTGQEEGAGMTFF